MNLFKFSVEETLFFNISGIAVFIAFWLYAVSWMNTKLDFFRKSGSLCLLVSLISLTVALVFRGMALNFFPLTNLYESLVIFAWAIIAAYLFLEYRFKINYFGW